MYSTSYIFKAKAVRALKGNWQTALIVAFLAGLPSTVNSLLRSTQLPQVSFYVSYEELVKAVEQISPSTVWLISIVGIVAFIITPMLNVSCSYYFIRRIQGKDLGVAGVLSRRTLFFRSLWLYVNMYIRIFAWSLLLIVPGIIAALRYAMAPYFLAENPEMTAGEAISKSKTVMADKKMSLFMLMLSFIGWALMALVAEMMLLSISFVLAMVAYQFIELFRVTYMNASIASFYLALSRSEGMEKAKKEADAFVQQITGQSPFRGDDNTEPEDEPVSGDEDTHADDDDVSDDDKDGEA